MCRSRIYLLSIPALLVVVAIVGCSKASVSKEKPTEAASRGEDSDAGAGEFASLSEEDRRAVRAQKFCAVEHESLLGSMGEPIKLMLEDQPVFLCCEGCREAALKDPKATLSAVAKLKKANSPSL